MKKTKQNYRPSLFLQSEWPLWLVVHHFLPPALLIDLMKVVVSDVTDGQSRLEDLFEIHLEKNQNFLADVPIRPIKIPIERKLECAVQRVLRSVFWSYDDYSLWDARLDGSDAIHKKLNVVILSLTLGAGDFATLEACCSKFSEDELDLYPILKNVFSRWTTFGKASRSGETVFVSENDLKISPILKSLLEKYVGDQFTDLGDWTSGKAQYESALRLMESVNNKELKPVLTAWKDQCRLSIASSIRTIEGPESAAKLIAHDVAACDLGEHPVLGITGSLDAMVYAFNLSEVEKRSLPLDVRGTFIQAALLSKNLDTATAFQKWLSGKQHDAFRVFWAIIRRQIANGSDVEVRASKHWYANSLLDRPVKEINGKDFLLAYRLLIESERSNDKERIQVDPEVIRSHFNTTVVNFGYKQANAYQGVRLRRLNVLMELYRAWFPHVSSDVIKRQMWLHAIAVAKDCEVSFQSEVDAGGSAFEALTSFAKIDTILSQEFGDSVAEIFVTSLKRKGHWRGVSLPLESIAEYIKHLNDQSVQNVVDAVLDLLTSAIAPKNEMWPVVRPVMRILTSKRLKDWAKSRKEYSSRILEQILRYGLEDASLRGDILFDLLSWDETILKEPAMRERLEPVIQSLQKDSKAYNSTACVRYIRSLLLASVFLTEEEFRTTIGSILDILKTVKDNGQHSMAFVDVYLAVLILVDKYEVKIIPDEKNDNWLSQQKNLMLEEVLRIWSVAERHPEIFEEFAIPRRGYPNKILVNNWAATSIRLARDCQKLNKIEAALDKASSCKQLTASIMKARVSENLFGGPDDLNLFSKVKEVFSQVTSAEEFYKILPTIVSAAPKFETDQNLMLVEELLKMMLRYGPNAQDASVIIVALYQKGRNTNMTLRVEFEGYESRLKSSRDSNLKDALSPLFFRLKENYQGESN